jgi:hypothetical protein
MARLPIPPRRHSYRSDIMLDIRMLFLREITWAPIMNTDRNRNDCHLISRRVALAGTACALSAAAAAAAVQQAVVREKISQADAKYESTPRGDQRCDGCISFQPPNAYKFVQGDISPSGWCELFAAKIPRDLKP